MTAPQYFFGTSVSKGVLSLTSCCLLFAAGCSDQPATEKPNVIVILTDDQGYGDVGYHGNDAIHTPTIDSMANDGVIFSNFYVSTRCAPTRAALMTGRYPSRTGVYHVTAGGYNLAAGEKTMAEYFREAGYNTGIMGKWHIGDHYPYLPADQGFDYSLIHHGGAIGQIADHPDNYWDMTKPLSQRKQCYFSPTLYKNRKEYQSEGYCADVFTDHALEFIDKHENNPFFLYLAYNTPHDPYQVPEKYLSMYEDLEVQPEMDTSNGSAFRLNDYVAAKYVYAMMSNMDDNLSRVVGKLKELSISDNTVIVFLSDNGPARYRYNGNLRGKKGQVFEGGIKVPCFINYESLPQSTKVEESAAHIDILPTLAHLCHFELDDKHHPADGINLIPLIEGEPETAGSRTLFLRETGYMEPFKEMMVRRGDYKLVGMDGPPDPQFKLFNLERDPYEKQDLSSEKPEKVNELKNSMDSLYKEMVKSPALRIHPIIIGSEKENPVRLSRHECVNTFSQGWFSRYYMGYYKIRVAEAGYYDFSLSFQEPINIKGNMHLRVGPIGRKMKVTESPVSEFQFEEVFLDKDDYVLHTWFQKNDQLISPFYVEVER